MCMDDVVQGKIRGMTNECMGREVRDRMDVNRSHT